MPRYKPVPMSAIPARYKRLAEAAVRDAARELGITPPVLTWWAKSPTGEYNAGVEVNGWADWTNGRYIALVDDVPAGELCGVVYHECRHIWQFQTGRFYGERTRAEEDAEAWTYQKTGYLGWPHYAR